MAKTLKVLGAIIGVAIILLGVSIAVLPLLIDPNQYKPQLAAIIKEKTGQEVEFSGDLHLSVFPWLGISTGRVQLNNGPAFQEAVFASIDQGEIKVKVLPLFAKRVEIDRIVLQGGLLNLIRNRDGTSNWRAFTATEIPVKEIAPVPPLRQTAKPPDFTFDSFGVGALSLQNARINWDDQQAGKRVSLQEINLKSGYLTFDQPAKVDLGFSVIRAEPSLAGTVSLQTDLTIGSGFEQIKMANSTLNLTRAGGKADEKPFAAVLTAPEIKYEKKTQQLDIVKLQLRSGDLAVDSDLTGTNLFKNPGVQGRVEIGEFNPGRLLQDFAMTLPKFQDANALSRLQAKFNLRVGEHSLSVSDLEGKLDETSLRGEVVVDDWTKPSIRFQLTMDQLDVDRYLPPKLKHKKMLVSPAAVIASGFSKIPAEQLRRLDAQGDVSLQHLLFSGMSVNDIRLKLVAQQGVIETRQAINGLYRGGYSGQVNIDAKGRETLLSLTENVEQVQIAPILQAIGSRIKMTGALSGSAKVRGQGRDVQEIRQGLKGRLTFALREGEVKELKFQKVLDQGISLLNHTPLPEDKHAGIDYSEISGTAALADNVIQNDDLLVTSSRFRIGGSGKADIESGKVDYRFVTQLVKAPATASEPEKLHSTPIVVTMTGTVDEPVYHLDMGALLTEKNKAKIEKLIDKNKDKIDKLKRKLDKKFGPGTSDLLKKLF